VRWGGLGPDEVGVGTLAFPPVAVAMVVAPPTAVTPAAPGTNTDC
jgi:hypothetical protein